ncbi:MAG TPA: CPBP family intramembrane glutamic endopeptidase [Candidatus Saccharimonadales bacterium]|nr:CPBP family intramembrane glutamic endopeptidase [Candidatus Saccharimonadales bacterium]
MVRPLNSIKSFIRNLSRPAEFFLVVLVCFWWGIIGSAKQFVGHLMHGAKTEQITNGLVCGVVIMQLLVMIFAFWVGRIRGWSLAMFGSRISWKGTFKGLLLLLVTILAMLFSVALTNVLAPGARNVPHVVNGVTVSRLTLPFILLFSLVNPIYEEVLGTGYFIHSLQRCGMLPSVLASACFRAFLHSYQGLDAIVIVLPMGLVFGFCYWRWRQLWPLIVAHIVFDLWPLLAFIHKV